MNTLIVSGSIRPEGKSAFLSDALADALAAAGDSVSLMRLSDDIDIDPCLACDFCKLGEGCVIEDAMGDLCAMLDEADRLIVVSPIYFAGPPAQFKAVLDRFQVYYWTDARTKPKRPALLFAIGDGGDPHGYEPLVGIVSSALAVAGFSLEETCGCIACDEGDLRYAVEATVKKLALGDEDSADGAADGACTSEASADEVSASEATWEDGFQAVIAESAEEALASEATGEAARG